MIDSMASQPSSDDRPMRATNLLFATSERFTLDPASPVPLYHQMERIILDRLASQGAVGKMLPPELQLIRMFGVSRATVKKAADHLAARGLIRRRRARGTEIISLGVREDLGRLTSYTEQMAQRGLNVGTVILEARECIPPVAIAGRLGLEKKQRVLSIRRLRGTSKVFPIVLLHSCIPCHFHISPQEDFTGSLYQLIETKYRLPILYADEEISARGATVEEARHLQIAAGSTVLVMQRLTYTTLDRPLEFVQAVYRPERYTFAIRLRR